MSDYLPPEILHLILLRLPAKPLCRFTTVSKSWRSLITSQAFIDEHLHHTTTHNAHAFTLLRRYSKEDNQEHYTLLPTTHGGELGTDQSLQMSTKIHLPVKTQPGYFRIVGSCGGLLCLSDDYFRDKSMIVLWNPSIEKHFTLPSPSIVPSMPFMFVLGFGMDSLRRDFKVVRVVYYANSSVNGYEVPPEAEVFSVKEKVWRRVVSSNVVCNVMHFMWSHAFANGHSHWIAWKDDGRKTLVLSFDMDSEVFAEIPLPEAAAPENFTVSVCGELLSVVEYCRATVNESCVVWVMKEYGVAKSWTNLYRVELGLGGLGMDRVVGLMPNGQVLMVNGGKGLALYDPATECLMDVGIYGTERAFYADRYLESLVLLPGEMNGVWEEDLSQLVTSGCRI